MKNKTFVILGSILGLWFLASQLFFIVPQTHKVLILQFGEMRRVYETPGLKMKLPFIQTVTHYDARLLDMSASAIEVTAKDQKRMVMDTFCRFSISDPLLFYKTVGSEKEARNRLSYLVPNSLRDALGNVTLAQVLSVERVNIMKQIRDQVNLAAKNFGVVVKDVRIVRADLPKENSAAIFKRMESARKKEAELIRAEGSEQAQGIRSRAERDRTVILAEARKKAQISRGDGDALAINISSQTFGQDPEFFVFYRSLEAYREALGNSETTLILSPQSDFFKHFLTSPAK